MELEKMEKMDTLPEVQEDASSETLKLDIPSYPPSRRMTGDSLDMENYRQSLLGSRRPSSIIATLRRPSQTLALTAASTVINQRKLMKEMMHKSKASSDDISKEKHAIKCDYNKRIRDDVLTTALSALYAKLIVVLGIAFPVTEIISPTAPPGFHQGFYLYLYFGSLAFIIFMYATLCKHKTLSPSISMLNNEKLFQMPSKKESPKIVRYGSFYLRLGAIAFGIGSMVYSGLEFGEYFELKKEPRCDNVLIALTPALRMILTIVQMQFIFLNSQEMELNRYTIIARFGMMHMIATNLCEWLNVIVEETKHEIIHLQHASSKHTNSSLFNETVYEVSHDDVIGCKRSNIMGSLVQNVAPFLFPCTVEYSLICAVILFEMWKHIKVPKVMVEEKLKRIPIIEEPVNNTKSRANSFSSEKLAQTFSLLFGANRTQHSSQHFSVDCAGAQRGLFTGILVIVMTIISLIIFFVLNKDPVLYKVAIYEVNVCEMILYVISLFATIVAIIKMRDLKYLKKNGGHPASLSLDTTLLVMAQTGVFIYCMFSILGSFFTLNEPDGTGAIGLLVEIFSLLQTIVQTMFVLGSWWRRCRSKAQFRNRPGRQVVTFLLVLNIALWITSTLEKGRAEFRPTHLTFFGLWPWTIITHVSMPMVIFYRFHSTICLFEIWKNTYKMKSRQY